MKINRRGLFGLGAGVALAPAAVVAAAKSAAGYGESPLMLAADDLAAQTRWHRAELMAAERAAHPLWVVHEDGTVTLMSRMRPWIVSNSYAAKE